MRRIMGPNSRETRAPMPAGRAITANWHTHPWFHRGMAGLTIWVLLSLSGCSGAGRTEILRPSEGNVRYSSAIISEEGSHVSVPAEVKKDFRLAFSRYLFDRGPFVHGPDLRIVYAITDYRLTEKGISSDGKNTPGAESITAEVRFINFVEKDIGSIRSHWDSGKSGSVDKAVKECARQVASYTEQHFWDVGKRFEKDRLTREEKQKSRWKSANEDAQ
jgi:hypothetical protein